MYNVRDTLFGFRREIAFAGYDDRDRCLMENGIKKKNYKPTWGILESRILICMEIFILV